MNIEWKTCFKIGVSIFLLYLAIYYWPSLMGMISMLIGASTPLIIGACLAYMINILMCLYEKHYFPKTKRKKLIQSRTPVCMTLALLTIFAIAALVIGLVIPELLSCIGMVITQLPGALDHLVELLAQINILPQDILDFLSSIDWQSKIGEIVNMLTSGIGNVMGVVIKTLSSVFSGVVNALLGLIFAVYLLLSRDKLGGQCKRVMKRYLKESWYDKIVYTLEILNDCFHRYIVGQCTEAVILGVLCTIGMLILRLPYATMIGALIAFTALIPIAGAYIGGGAGAFMIMMVSPVKAVVFVIFLVLLQQFEGNLIYPRVVGSSMGLPAIWVLAAVTVGGGLMGIPGMLLGVPIAAALYRLLRNDVNKPLKKTAAKPEEVSSSNESAAP